MRFDAQDPCGADSQNKPMATAEFMARLSGPGLGRLCRGPQGAGGPIRGQRCTHNSRGSAAAGHTSCNAFVELLNARKVATADWAGGRMNKCAKYFPYSWLAPILKRMFDFYWLFDGGLAAGPPSSPMAASITRRCPSRTPIILQVLIG